jgi:tetratricopeptide (TPR) repeat protein
VELTALADPARFPRLVRLGLRYSALGDATCDALAGILDRLDSLDLRGGTISDAGAAVLAAHAPQRLALAVDDNLIGSAGQAVLAARGPQSSIGAQRAAPPGPRAAQTRHPERLPPANDAIAEHLRAASRHRAGHDLVAQIAALREAVAVAVAARYRSREASIRDTLAHALHDNGRLLEARHELERALALFERLREPAGIRRARQMLALVLLELGDDAAGTALAARFQDDGDPEERAHSLAALAGHASGRGDHAKARGLYEQAGVLVAGQPYERHIKHMLAVMDQLQNDLDGARRGYEHVLAQLQGDGDVRERAKVLQNVAGVYWLQSEWARAEAAYREAGEVSVRIGDRRNHAHVLSNLGNLLNWRGDYAASVATAAQAVQLFRDIGFADGLRKALGMAADANLQAGHFDHAQRLSAEALAAGREVGDPAAIGLGLKIHADLAKHRWELDAAEQLCHEALAIYRDSHNAYGIAGALLGIAHVQLARGDLAGPEPLIVEAAAHYATRGLDHGWAGGAHALLELARGDTTRAVERCRDALDRAIAGVNPVQIRRLTARYAAVLAAHGDVATARDHLATAAALFADTGDALGTTHLDVCRARVAGTTAPPRPAPFEARLMWQLLFADA